MSEVVAACYTGADMIRRTQIVFVLGVTAMIVLSLFGSAGVGHASTVEDLRASIEAKNAEIQKLEAEAQKYRDAIANQQDRGRTLAAELSRIKKTIAQLRNDVSVTQGKIQRAGLELDQLSLEISDTKSSIDRLRSGLSDTLKAFSEQDQASLLEVFLRNRALSDFFGYRDHALQLQQRLVTSLDTLHDLQTQLEGEQTATAQKKKELEGLQANLQGQQKAQETIQTDRQVLLVVTKNQESRYQQLLAEQEKKRAALEEEIQQIEQAIRVTIDPNSLPSKGLGVLDWPLPDVSLKSCWNGGAAFKNCVTQFFGYTSFAAIGGYAGKGHNGVDFRAAIGTPVLAAADGIVQGVGDTDVQCKGASYGKWVLLGYPNNLSTVYGHLSAINVSQGQSVKRGQTIAFSGMSGYALGPHLHVSVYASAAVEIQPLRSKICGTVMTLPISATNGYLNPMDYF